MNKFRKVFVFLTILAILVPNISFAKDVDNYSKSSILINQKTNRVLYEKDPDTKRPLASLSKMMTFLIAIESIESGLVNRDDVITIDSEAARVKGSTYKLKEGEEIPLIHLMKGLMIVSGNDAAIAISKHISGDVDSFVDLMNKRCQEIGMKSTSFVNPHGLPIYSMTDKNAPAKENLSTARDIVTLGKYLFDNYEEQTLEITDMQTYDYPERSFLKNNTNPLLSMYPNVDGMKTGYTGNAGYCLCFSMKIDKDDKNEVDSRLIGVTLGANHKNKRLQASNSMLNYGKENFTTVKNIDKDLLIGKKYIDGIEELEVTLKTKDELFSTISLEESIKSQITMKEITYPIKKGDVVGVIKYYTQNEENLGSVEIISDTTIEEVNFETKLKILKAKYLK